MLKKPCLYSLFACLICAGCGPDASDFNGVYEGKLERTEKRDALTFMQEYKPYSVFISPGASEEIFVQLRDECAVMAQMQKEGEFEIVAQPCKRERDSSGLDAIVNGSGVVSEEGTLTLTFTLEGTGRLNMNTYTYSSTESFTGVAQ